MAVKTIKVTGILEWCKVFEENRDMTGFEDAWVDDDGRTSINVILSDEEFAKLKAAKSMLKGRKTEDGETSVRFNRKWVEKLDFLPGGAPKVLKADGTPWSYADDGVIPNGSIGEVTVEVYSTSRATIFGTRLEKVKVLSVAVMDDEEDSDEVPF